MRFYIRNNLWRILNGGVQNSYLPYKKNLRRRLIMRVEIRGIPLVAMI